MKVLIHTMGRVGTIALNTALYESGIESVTGHYIFGEGEYPTKKPNINLSEFKLITILRNPRDRNLSAFFRDYEKYFNKEIGLIGSFLKNYPHRWPFVWCDTEFKASRMLAEDVLVLRTEKLSTEDTRLKLERYLNHEVKPVKVINEMKVRYKDMKYEILKDLPLGYEADLNLLARKYFPIGYYL